MDKSDCFFPNRAYIGHMNFEGEIHLWDPDSGGCEFLETDDEYGLARVIASPFLKMERRLQQPMKVEM